MYMCIDQLVTLTPSVVTGDKCMLWSRIPLQCLRYLSQDEMNSDWKKKKIFLHVSKKGIQSVNLD